MNARAVEQDVRLDEMKCLSRKQLAAYLNIGTSKATEIGENADAVVRVGRRVLFNRSLIDEYIDEISE